MATLFSPINLVATAVGYHTINLTWELRTIFNDYLEIAVKEDGGAYAILWNTNGTDKSISITNCEDGTLYYFKVRGRNDNGDGTYSYSDYSAEVSATTPLPAPTLPTATVNSASQVTLTWVDNSDNETGFEVYSGIAGAAYALLTTTAAEVETYVVTGLTASTPYWFKIRAVNAAANSEYSAQVSAFTNQAAATLANTGHQDILIIDRVSAEVTKHKDVTTITTVTVSDVLTSTFEIIATDAGTHKIDTTHADNGYPISSYIRTKDLDFTDQYPDLAGMVKTVKKFRLLYEDVDASTPVTVYVSNDGGANWGICANTIGTGDGTTKYADFYFMNSDYVTGLNFTFKVESLSTTTDFLWLAFEIEFMVRGEAFNV